MSLIKSPGTFWDMLGAQVAPNEISFSSAISACEASAQWQLALGLLAAMPEFKVTPNHVCFNAVISAFEKSGLWQKAFHALLQMESVRITPDEISFSAVISACEKGQSSLRDRPDGVGGKNAKAGP